MLQGCPRHMDGPTCRCSSWWPLLRSQPKAPRCVTEGASRGFQVPVFETEDEMAGWHHWLDGRESEWTPGVGDGQGGLVCYDSWGHKESDMTERLNWTELNSLGVFPIEAPDIMEQRQVVPVTPFSNSWPTEFVSKIIWHCFKLVSLGLFVTQQQ